ncbi:MAG: MltA domain-containing protein [Hyphomicrobiales bacterium]|nr:MltA domain-containing protein [Hyphomicrobiales bacterium]
MSAPDRPQRPVLPDGLTALSYEQIAGWRDDDHAFAFAAFLRSAHRILDKPPKRRHAAVNLDALVGVARRATGSGPVTADTARHFFEDNFQPARIDAQGFVTGYYEPELAASPVRTGQFTVPLYRRPPDLIDVDDANRPAGWDRQTRFGRLTGAGIVAYADRAAIEDGALAGKGLELAWLADPVDAYFVHIQGSARLRMAGGGLMRVAFDGKSGHAYTSIGRLAVERGYLSAAAADKAGLEAWLRQNPQDGRDLMRHNRSYIFFRQTPQIGPEEGPMGAAGVALTGGRSLAVDRTLMTFHTPVWVDVDAVPDRDAPADAVATRFRRLMIAQDTGSAIIGPARGDLFFGSGDDAGARAGRVRHRAEMTLLLPVAEAGERR